MKPTWDEYKVTVPTGKSGDWEVIRFTVSEEDEKMERLRAFIHRSRRYVPAGTYTKLSHHGNTIMSDTPDEISDHFAPIRYAHGHVLINGLGLGVVLQAIARKPEVTHVTVVELSPDVITLVWPHYVKMFKKKIEVVQADALTYKPPKGVRYGAVWHDIWPTINSDNLLAMHTLTRKYGRRTEWQGSWMRWMCEDDRNG